MKYMKTCYTLKKKVNNLCCDWKCKKWHQNIFQCKVFFFKCANFAWNFFKFRNYKIIIFLCMAAILKPTVWQFIIRVTVGRHGIWERPILPLVHWTPYWKNYLCSSSSVCQFFSISFPLKWHRRNQLRSLVSEKNRKNLWIFSEFFVETM